MRIMGWMEVLLKCHGNGITMLERLNVSFLFGKVRFFSGSLKSFDKFIVMVLE